MILATHFLAGAAVAAKAPPVFLGLLLGFLSHYFLDAILHTDYRVFTASDIKNHLWRKSLPDFLKVSLDLWLGIIIVLIITKNPLLALAGGFLAIIPDVLTFLFFLFPENKFLIFHRNIHVFIDSSVGYLDDILKEKLWSKKFLILGGILTQLIFISISLFFLQR